MIRINSIYAILFMTLFDFGINVSVADVRNEAFNDDGGCFSATFSNDTSHFVGSWTYDNPDCDVSPDYESNWPYDYYCPCIHRSGGEATSKGRK